METSPKRKNVSKASIANFWCKRIPETDINVDWNFAEKYCWACGYKKKLEKAHIIPHCLGGITDPSNMVLLCRECNLKNPHCKSEEDFWIWIKSHRKNNFWVGPDTFNVNKIFREYEDMYSENLYEKLIKLFKDQKLNMMQEFETFKANSGAYWLNNISTHAVFLRDFVNFIENKKTNM